MIFSEAFRSLRTDKTRAFFYWLTLLLTTVFMYLYFNIAMDESIGMSLGQTSNNIIVIVTLISVIICALDIFFANDYYTRIKAFDLAIRLVSGATYLHIAGFLLIQTVFLMVLAVPPGVLIAKLMMKPLNILFSSVLPGLYDMAPVREGVIYTYVVLGFIIVWMVVMNLSFTYLNSASQLVNQRNAAGRRKGSGFYMKSVPAWLRQLFWLFLFVMPVVTFYLNRDAIVLFSCIGMVGFNGALQWIIVPMISRILSSGKADPVRTAWLGFVREDLQAMKFAMYLLLVSVVIMASILMTHQQNPLESVVITLSYGFLSVLQAMALMFRCSNILSSRVRHFASLARIGFTYKQLKEITRKEVFGYYGSVLLICLLYLVNIFISLRMAGQIETGFAVFLVLIVAVPLIVCACINLFNYRKTVLSNMTEKEFEDDSAS
ncbi:MAG: hypothetical protein E7190_10540 [Erysipelotrichaceae bacterium]|nr:hypothetical protein [Erysipelotrichaceae bacterium]